MHSQVGLREQALTIIKDNPAGLTAYEQAEMVMHWCLSEWLCNNIPALRLFCIRSMQRPTVPDGTKTCTDPECQRPAGTCKGNRLEVQQGVYDYGTSSSSLKPTPPTTGEWAVLLEASRHAPPTSASHDNMAAHDTSGIDNSLGCDGDAMEDDSDSIDTSEFFTMADATYQPDVDEDVAKPTQPVNANQQSGGIVPHQLSLMKLVLPHHKMEDDWGRHALEFVIPYDLALATHLYLEYAYPLLNPDMELTHLFLRPHRRGPLGTEHLAQLWADIQRRYAAPWSHFPPNQFRSIHVLDRVQHLASAAARVGVDLHGDAAVMQNTASSKGVWETNYCKQGQYYNEMVKGTLDRMTDWRHEQLTALHEAKLRQQQEEQQQEAADIVLDCIGANTFAYNPELD